MSGQDYVVPPQSWARIGQLTNNIRVQFSLSSKPDFPVMEFLERVLDHKLGTVRLEIGSREEMGAYEGLTDPAGEFIILREDVYEKASSEDGRARFTVAHELGHFFLHTGISMARASPNAKVAPFRLSEAQANQFAAELLMPRGFMLLDDVPQAVADRHGVSFEAAKNRVKYMRSQWSA